MKKLVSLFLVIVMVMSLTSLATAEEFSATSKGFGGEITVTLTIDGDKLTDVQVVGAGETIGVGTIAIEKLPAKMLATNSVEIDSIAGATISSNAILEAATNALKESGATLAKVESVEDDSEVYEDIATDIVVVGGGITGLSAAIVIADAGNDVILLESTNILGGAATISHSSVWAVGNEMTKDQYDFTADEIYDFFNKQAGPVHSKDVFYALANESYNSLHFLIDNGVDFNQINPCNPQADTRFWCSESVDYGVGMMRSLIEAYNTRNVDTRMSTSAVALLQDETGAVTGVVAECNGRQYNIEAKKVILATGGIGRNPEMCKEYVPGYANLASNMTVAGNTGEGHKMGVAVGGYLVGTGSMGVGTSATGITYSTAGMGLMVNVEGEQVGAANEHYTKLYLLLNESSNGTLYSIYTSDIADYSTDGSVEMFEENYKNGEMFKADTVEDLAEQMGINVETLMATIERYNAQCVAGESDGFNTPTEWMCPIVNGPFYGDTHQAGMIGTVTALAVDADMNVITEDGALVENLYAGGEMIYGNWFEGSYPMSGTGLSGCVSSARIAAANAIAGLE